MRPSERLQAAHRALDAVCAGGAEAGGCVLRQRRALRAVEAGCPDDGAAQGNLRACWAGLADALVALACKAGRTLCAGRQAVGKAGRQAGRRVGTEQLRLMQLQVCTLRHLSLIHH